MEMCGILALLLMARAGPAFTALWLHFYICTMNNTSMHFSPGLFENSVCLIGGSLQIVIFFPRKRPWKLTTRYLSNYASTSQQGGDRDQVTNWVCQLLILWLQKTLWRV